ncbi:MAG: hypothetical protein QOI58_1508 [Thermoanaerobaculia bacterium]|jgi:hypothetical protein|nr:hypothetical protein [Thermoanaerobaculia bacterium]
MPTNECIEALESDLAQYVLDRKVDESMKRYLRTRVYPIASILGAVLVFFGIQLSSIYKNYSELVQRAKKAENTIVNVSGELKGLESNWITTQRRIEDQFLVAKTTLASQEDILKTTYARQATATEHASQIAAQIEQKLTEARTAADTAARHVIVARDQATIAKDSAANATASKKLIDDAKTAATKYREEVTKQQHILGTTIVDFAILARNIPSTVTLHNPRDFEHPITLKLTPQSVTTKGFTISVEKNGSPDEPLRVDSAMFGRWQELPVTGGLYRYMVDFVYEQRGVRNFVVMRFGGSPKLFETPEMMTQIGSK